MFRPKSYSMKIWRIKDGTKPFYMKGYRLAQKPGVGFVTSTLKSQGKLSSVQVVGGPLLELSDPLHGYTTRQIHRKFCEYYDSNEVIDVFVPKDFNPLWRIN